MASLWFDNLNLDSCFLIRLFLISVRYSSIPILVFSKAKVLSLLLALFMVSKAFWWNWSTRVWCSFFPMNWGLSAGYWLTNRLRRPFSSKLSFTLDIHRSSPVTASRYEANRRGFAFSCLILSQFRRRVQTGMTSESTCGELDSQLCLCRHRRPRHPRAMQGHPMSSMTALRQIWEEALNHRQNHFDSICRWRSPTHRKT